MTFVKMEGKTNFLRHLIRLSGTGIVECLKIIDVRCNLKQFDVEADRNAFFIFGPTKMPTKMKFHFLPKKTKTKTKVTFVYITELSYGSVANITFSAQRK